MSSYFKVYEMLTSGQTLADVKANPETANLVEGFLAYGSAPSLGGLKIIFDAPALLINVLITILVYRGIKESRNASNMMVLVKLAIVLLVIFVST